MKNLQETAVVLASCYKKYPFAMQILQNPSTFKGVSKARWHCIIPQFLKFTDNTIKFGEHIELNLKVDETRDGYELSEVQATLDT